MVPDRVAFLRMGRSLIRSLGVVVEEARRIIGTFIAQYNREWIVERLGYRTPAQARRDAIQEAA